MLKGRLTFLAEAFVLLTAFLLPLKFGAIVGLPAVTMIYWTDLFPLILSPWPSTYFPFFAALSLLLTLLLTSMPRRADAAGLFALAVCAVAGTAFLGRLAPGTVINYSMHYIPYCLGLACMAFSVMVLDHADPDFKRYFYSVFATAFALSLASGLMQYFSGFEMTLEHIKKQELTSGVAFQGNMKNRLLERRISADFSACNAYAGYLVLGIPIFCAWLWSLGSYVRPPKLSRLVFALPALGVSLFVLVKTGSRGAVLSLMFAVILFFLFSKMKMLTRFLLFLVLLAAGGVGLTVLHFWRGVLSLVFRLDYFQAALRMMLESPYLGTGWGGFFRNYLLLKIGINDEAPHSPHNTLLTIGSQTGWGGFLAALIMLSVPLVMAVLTLKRENALKNLDDGNRMYSACAVGFFAWTIHSMMDVTFETPAAMALGLFIAVFLCRNAGEVKWFPARFLYLPLSLLLIGGTVYYGVGLIRFDAAYSALYDLCDPRSKKQEEILAIPLNRVYEALSRCDELGSHASPFEYLQVSSLMTLLGNRDEALRLLDEAIRRAPRNAAMQYRRYQLLKTDPARRTEALRALEKALEYFPNHPGYREEMRKERNP